MKAFVLAAGFGTRLKPLTMAVPKPMIPIVNKPVMQYNIELLKKYWIKDIFVNIHYFPEQVENYFDDGSRFGVKIRYSFEEQLLGTAGGVKRMAKDLAGVKDTFIVISSDALTDVNLNRMISFHKSKKALVTIGLAQVKEPSQFGIAVLDENDRITSFQEKPKKEDAKSDLANASIYIMEPEVLGMIPDGHYDFGKQLFPALAEKGGAIYGYRMVEYWNDVGSVSQLEATSNDIMKGLVRVNIPGRKIGGCTWINKDAKIDHTAKFEGCVYLGFGSVIGKNVRFYGNVVIGDGTVVKDDAVIIDSIIWSNTVIGSGTKVKKSLIGNWCNIGEGVNIPEGCVVSNRCNIPAGRKLQQNTVLEPDKTA